MAEVVPLRVSIFEAAHNIAIKFAKADNTRAKAQSLRVEIGIDLIDLQRRFEAGEACKPGEPQEFWAWIKLRCHKSVKDMRKCIALARAKDPEAAAAKERDDTRARVKQHRANQQDAYRTRPTPEDTQSEEPAKVVSLDPAKRLIEVVRKALKAFTAAERESFFAQMLEIEEEFPC